MPAAPLYARRLPEAISTLESLPAEWIDRRTLEQILGVSKWTAWRVLKRCGIEEGPGKSLLCRRDDLVRRLRHLEYEEAPEIARRERLERQLESMATFVRRRHTEIARGADAAGLLHSRLCSLPPGVDLTPSELRIRFSGMPEFLEKFARVVFALQNDFETIQQFVNGNGLPSDRPAI